MVAPEPVADTPAPAATAATNSTGLASSGVMGTRATGVASSRQALPLSAAIAVSLAETTFRPVVKPKSEDSEATQPSTPTPTPTSAPTAQDAPEAVQIASPGLASGSDAAAPGIATPDASDSPPGLQAAAVNGPDGDATVGTEPQAADALAQASEAATAEAAEDLDTEAEAQRENDTRNG